MLKQRSESPADWKGRAAGHRLGRGGLAEAVAGVLKSRSYPKSNRRL